MCVSEGRRDRGEPCWWSPGRGLGPWRPPASPPPCRSSLCCSCCCCCCAQGRCPPSPPAGPLPPASPGGAPASRGPWHRWSQVGVQAAGPRQGSGKKCTWPTPYCCQSTPSWLDFTPLAQALLWLRNLPLHCLLYTDPVPGINLLYDYNCFVLLLYFPSAFYICGLADGWQCACAGLCISVYRYIQNKYPCASDGLIFPSEKPPQQPADCVMSEVHQRPTANSP